VKFKRFEDMPVWQDARKLTNLVYRMTKGEPFRRDFGLSQQIHRASVSVMSNIAEGYERLSKSEFILFLGYAKGSTGGVRCQLYVASDLSCISSSDFTQAFDLCVFVSQQLANLITHLRNT
jgi:four helix bundle protein